MDGLPPDLGKLVLAGYINADPPKEPQFALTAAGSGYATTIQQAGGEVTVDNLGGIGLLASSGSQLGIDSFAKIFLETVGEGTILLETAGSGFYPLFGTSILKKIEHMKLSSPLF